MKLPLLISASLRAHVVLSGQFYRLFRWSRCGHSLAFALTLNQHSLRPTAQSMKATGGISLASNATGRTVQVGCLSKSSVISLVLLCCGASAYPFENNSHLLEIRLLRWTYKCSKILFKEICVNFEKVTIFNSI